MGGGGGGTTTSTTYTSNLPEWAEPYYVNMMERAENASVAPYVPYTGQRIAELSPGQMNAYYGVSNLQHPEQIGQATDMTTGAALASIGNTGNFQNFGVDSMYDPSMWSGEVAARYMNPFAQNVTDTALRKLENQYLTQKVARDANSVKTGAFGGSRQALIEAAAQKDMNQQYADLQYKGMFDAYNNAANLFNTDRSALADAAKMQLAADTSNQSAAAQAAQIRQAGYSAGLQGAQQLGQLGATDQELNLNRYNMLNSLGKEQQQTKQQLLDQQYADFANARDYERNQLTFLSGILRGTDGVLGQDSVSTTPTAGIGSQLAGLGIAAAGALGKSSS